MKSKFRSLQSLLLTVSPSNGQSRFVSDPSKKMFNRIFIDHTPTDTYILQDPREGISFVTSKDMDIRFDGKRALVTGAGRGTDTPR